MEFSQFPCEDFPADVCGGWEGGEEPGPTSPSSPLTGDTSNLICQHNHEFLQSHIFTGFDKCKMLRSQSWDSHIDERYLFGKWSITGEIFDLITAAARGKLSGPKSWHRYLRRILHQVVGSTIITHLFDHHKKRCMRLFALVSNANQELRLSIPKPQIICIAVFSLCQYRVIFNSPP